MNKITCIALVVLVTPIAGILGGCGGVGASSSPPPAISVSINGGTSQTVAPGQSITITASVANDSAQRGVTWTLTGPGTLTRQSATSVEYDAPATVAGSATATVTATAIADTTKSSALTVTITQLAVSVSVSPTSAGVAVNSQQDFTATVDNDPGNKGVTWTLTQGGTACSPGCGSISSASAATTTYTAPANVPANPAVTLTATAAADKTKSASATVTISPPPITISVDPPSALVLASGTQAFTATVTNDPTNSGVTWTIVPGSGAGTLSDATKTSVAYHAPANPPASSLDVTLVATSVADHAATQTVSVTVPAITVAISPKSAILPINLSQQFTATVANDAANKGVKFTLTQNGAACSPACGMIASSAVSGVPTTYTAPASVPADPVVTLTAASAADTSKSDTATLNISLGTVKLVPGALTFGVVKVGRSVSLSTILTNTGNSTLNIASVTVTGTDIGDFIPANNCGSTVGAGASCTIGVAFKPTVVGIRRAVLSISDDSVGSPQQVQLSGTGIRRTGITGSTLSTTTSVAVPKPTGADPVGTRVLHLVDSTAPDPYLADGTKRELMVRFWYPASLKDGCKPAEYTSPAVWSYFSQLLGAPLPHVTTNSCLDAPIKSGAYPVVVFTHGYTGTFTDYTFLFEDLASRGYVVASVAHTYETTAVEFPGGRVVESFVGSHLGDTLRSDEQTLSFAVSARLSDLKFVVSELGRLNGAPGNPFTGRLDVSRVAVAGHSLGGLTAMLEVEDEPRFRAGIIIDGVMPEHLSTPTTIPMFIMAAGREQWSDEECRIWSDLRGPRLAVNLRGAEHLTPSDAIWLLRGQVKTGEMGANKTVAAVRDYVAAFLDANLRNKSSALLTSASSGYSDAVVTTRHQRLGAEQCTSAGSK